MRIERQSSRSGLGSLIPDFVPKRIDQARDLGHVRVNESEESTQLSIRRPTLICGDALRALQLLPDGCTQTVVTSPPYWSLRDYAIDEQVGRDERLEDYVSRIVTTFDAIRRVLRDDGTVWLNVGDVFTSGNRRSLAPDRKNRARAMSVRPPTPQGLKPKDLIGVPWRLAFALQRAGWWLRSEIIWSKPNAHPESVRDRPTKSHETIFCSPRVRITIMMSTQFTVLADDVFELSGTFLPSL